MQLYFIANWRGSPVGANFGAVCHSKNEPATYSSIKLTLQDGIFPIKFSITHNIFLLSVKKSGGEA